MSSLIHNIENLFTYSDPEVFLDYNFNQIIQSIPKMENRKDVLKTYKKLNNLFKFPTYFPGILFDIKDVRNTKYAKIDYEEIVKTAIYNQLVKIERFEPYREAVYNKLKEIHKYYERDFYHFDIPRDFYFKTKPSIHGEVSNYINMKIFDNEEILYSDYFLLFNKIKLTPFGFDHFHDITDELKNIIEQKHKNPSSLIMYYFNKFNRSNSYYSYKVERLTEPLEYNKPGVGIFDEGSVDNSDKFTYHPGVSFCEITTFKNKIAEYYRIAENTVRDRMELPRVDEGWISETRLFKEIQKSLKPLKVIHHAKLKFLGRQHLDIFIPYLSAAIEYQGLQHSEPVDFFGGVEGFKQTVIRDQKKASLCKENGVHLIYVEEGYILEDILSQLEMIRSTETT